MSIPRTARTRPSFYLRSPSLATPFASPTCHSAYVSCLAFRNKPRSRCPARPSATHLTTTSIRGRSPKSNNHRPEDVASWSVPSCAVTPKKGRMQASLGFVYKYPSGEAEGPVGCDASLDSQLSPSSSTPTRDTALPTLALVSLSRVTSRCLYCHH